MRKRRRLYLLACLTCALTAAGEPLRPVTLEEYTKELDRLHTVVETCAQELSSKNKACDPSQVGPDEMVSIPTGQRFMGYDWLRDTLRQAASAQRGKDGDALRQASTALSEAGTRLQQMTRVPRRGIYVPDNVSNIRTRLNAILQSGDYPQAKPPSLLQRIWNGFLTWLFHALARVMPGGSSTSAIYLLEFTVIAIPCGLLVWWFVRRLRLQRLDLPRENVASLSTPSAQGWQEWLAQGQRLSGEGRWREAIHHVYWGAISCLESRRLWAADRARTPREYLRLLNTNTEMHADLFSLTKSFEQTWYGETTAGENEFHQACSVLERIAAR